MGSSEIKKGTKEVKMSLAFGGKWGILEKFCHWLLR